MFFCSYIFHEVPFNILKSLDKKLEFDIVIHLAAETKVHNSVLNPKIYYDTNVIGTYNVIENLQCEYFINVTKPGISKNIKSIDQLVIDPKQAQINKIKVENKLSFWGILSLPIK